MRIPRKIKIGPHEVKVVFKKSLHDNGHDLSGWSQPDKGIICLKYGIEKSRRAEIFLHECIHYMDDIYALRLDEPRINVLTNAILTFIKRNNLDFRK